MKFNQEDGRGEDKRRYCYKLVLDPLVLERHLNSGLCSSIHHVWIKACRKVELVSTTRAQDFQVQGSQGRGLFLRSSHRDERTGGSQSEGGVWAVIAAGCVGRVCWDHSIFIRNRSRFLHNVKEPYMKWKVRSAIGAELLQALSYVFSKLVVP
jgi:hypothetical protein